MVDVATLPKGNGRKLLVVEDDTLVLETIRQMLDQLDYRYVTAESPQAAIDFIRSESGNVGEGDPIDGMISDVIMPDISGPDLWRQLLAEGIRVPTLFISGYLKSDFPLREHDVRLIRKPVEIDALAKSLDAVLSVSSS